MERKQILTTTSAPFLLYFQTTDGINSKIYSEIIPAGIYPCIDDF